ncbi:MAG TPA: arylamine N-acetyltransferase, partial [Polyangiaceae bacterium LLY-WYZ-15_(1-7)]|nr:arylamine N-acetyltransferase [Polyangiaceae bacterium LLY-WYZ-15_(1-7)]
MSPGDLDAYLARVGWRGARRPTRRVLDGLMAAHVAAIPFENLDVLLGRGVDLADVAVFDKLVHRRRGGYCFEQNGLFARALSALGFRVEALAARARVGRAREETPPRTHLALAVEAEGARWLVDVGLGGLSMTGAIRFEEGVVQATPHEPRRLLWEGGRWWHQARLDAGWVDVCELTGEAMPPIDREVASFFASAHPRSAFREAPMVARALPGGGRLGLRGDVLTLRGARGAERVRLADAEA